MSNYPRYEKLKGPFNGEDAPARTKRRRLIKIGEEELISYKKCNCIVIDCDTCRCECGNPDIDYIQAHTVKQTRHVPTLEYFIDIEF